MEKSQRKIIHIDMDAFYASVEIRDNPELAGKPVGIGGRPEERSVLCTANYEARKFGVHSAMSSSRALILCPELILIPPDMKKYSIVSKQIRNIMYEYTDIIEPLSLDECYLDVTNNKKHFRSATEIALEIKNRIRSELNLTASAGVAPNKLIAKIASDMNKPDGLTVIKPNDIHKFMKDLSIKKIWGVGKVTQKKMESMNILNCSDLQKYEMTELLNHFGKFGESLYYFCRGIDNREVETNNEVKSIGSEITFPSDSVNLNYLKEKLYKEVESISYRLEKSKIKGKTITLKVKYSDFTSITRSKTINEYTDNQTLIFQTCLELINKTEIGKKPVRLIGASVTNFFNEENIWKNSMFDGLIN